MQKYTEKNLKKKDGITLIGLVITIIILLILAGVAIGTLAGDNGLIKRAQLAKQTNTLSSYKEQFDLFKLQKMSENPAFNVESLTAGKNQLTYNTQEEGETGTIKTIIPDIKDEYIETLEVIKGSLVLNTTDISTIKIAQSVGIEPSPYNIKDGELTSSKENLLLVDSNGVLKLPNSVTVIGEGTFANTEADGVTLKKVIIPSTVKQIKANAFNGNTSIEEIEIQTNGDEGVKKIGAFAFANCIKLQSIVLPDTVTEIGDDTFSGCTSLNDVKISKNITQISYEMFRGCKSIKKVEIPEGINKISAGGFRGCESLEEITLPKTLKTIAENVFYNNYRLEKINIDKNAEFVFKKGMLMNKNETDIYYLTDETVKVATFRVPDGIKQLKPGLLRYDNIKKVIIPASVTNILADFFISSVQEVEIDENNEIYLADDSAMYNKDKTILCFYFGKDSEITIKEGVTEIGRRALINVSATTVNLPKSLEKLDAYAIYNGKVNKINMEGKVNHIDGSAFALCDADVNIASSNNYYIFEKGIIYNKEKTKLISCTKNIVNVEIPEGITEIGENAFLSREKLECIKLPETLENIGERALASCTNLVELDIPSSVNIINSDAFKNTSNLKKIKINKTAGSISGAPWGNMYGERIIEWKN